MAAAGSAVHARGVRTPTLVTTPRSDCIWMWLLLPAGGAVSAAAVYGLRGLWLAEDWLPWRPAAVLADRLATSLGGWALPAFLAAGFAVGLVLATIASSEDVAVTVADDRVRIVKGSSMREHRSADVREVLVDGGHLVLVAHNGTDLSRTRTGLPSTELAEAFRSHGYRWVL
jgi:hypothetical protein